MQSNGSKALQKVTCRPGNGSSQRAAATGGEIEGPDAPQAQQVSSKSDRAPGSVGSGKAASGRKHCGRSHATARAALTGESGGALGSGRPGGAARSVLVTNSAIACASAVVPLPAHAQPSWPPVPGRATPSCASVMYTADSHLDLKGFPGLSELHPGWCSPSTVVHPFYANAAFMHRVEWGIVFESYRCWPPDPSTRATKHQ